MSQQSTFRLAAFCAAVLISLTAAHAGPVSIATSFVGDPGNVADSALNSGLGSDPTTGTGAGAVSYGYNIGTYDVTLNQYCAFLNAVAAIDPNAHWSSANDPTSAGISRSGSPGSFRYSVIGSGQRPVTYVNWYSAARFCNWLTNGQGSGGTETGVYTLTLSKTISGILPADHSALVGTGTKWFLPTEGEWYKAAYYNATGSSYYKYPFQSNTRPTVNLPALLDSNSGNFYNGVYAVSQSATFPTSNALTDVGAYPNALCPYGLYDMGGDVYQWTETLEGSDRVLRGQGWVGNGGLAASERGSPTPTIGGSNVGFRVAMVTPLPEPSTITLFLLGAIGVFFASRRRLNSHA